MSELFTPLKQYVDLSYGKQLPPPIDRPNSTLVVGNLNCIGVNLFPSVFPPPSYITPAHNKRFGENIEQNCPANVPVNPAKKRRFGTKDYDPKICKPLFSDDDDPNQPSKSEENVKSFCVLGTPERPAKVAFCPGAPIKLTKHYLH